MRVSNLVQHEILRHFERHWLGRVIEAFETAELALPPLDPSVLMDRVQLSILASANGDWDKLNFELAEAKRDWRDSIHGDYFHEDWKDRIRAKGIRVPGEWKGEAP